MSVVGDLTVEGTCEWGYETLISHNVFTCFSNKVFRLIGGKPCEELHDVDKDLCLKNLFLEDLSKDLVCS